MPKHSDLRLRYDEQGNRISGLTDKDELEKQRKEELKERTLIRLDDERAKRQENAIQDLKKSVEASSEKTKEALKLGLKPLVEPGKNVLKALASLTPVGMLAVKTYDIVKSIYPAGKSKAKVTSAIADTSNVVAFPKNVNKTMDSLDKYLRFKQKTDEDYRKYLKHLSIVQDRHEKISKGILKETKANSDKTTLIVAGVAALGLGVIGAIAWLKNKFGGKAQDIKNSVDSAIDTGTKFKTGNPQASPSSPRTVVGGDVRVGNSYGSIKGTNLGLDKGTITTPYNEYRVRDKQGNYVTRANGRIGGWTEAEATKEAKRIGGTVITHKGIDLSHYEGYPIRTPIAGTLSTKVDKYNGGLVLVTGDPEYKGGPVPKWQVIHCQLTKDGKVKLFPGLRNGSKVQAGDPVAYEGNTGASHGAHQDIRMWWQVGEGTNNRAYVDPTPFYLPTDTIGSQGGSTTLTQHKNSVSGVTGGAANISLIGKNNSILGTNNMDYRNRTNATADNKGYKGTLPSVNSFQTAGIGGAGQPTKNPVEKETVYFASDNVLLNSLASNSNNVRMV